ncbi:MAG: carbohydrate-binding protein, partial [Flavobacterium sp.]
ATTDLGGGLNVSADIYDRLYFDNIYFPTTGTYLIEYRVASPKDVVVMSADLDNNTINLGNVFVPNTGGWQKWQTVKQTVTVNAGTYKFGIWNRNTSVNINWIRISRIEPETTALIQAEDYSTMAGITTEATTDLGGGLNIRNTDSYNWLGYNNVNFPTSGSYLIEYRVASAVDGGQIYPDILVGDFFKKIDVPNTGGWQNWQTVKQMVSVNAGTYNFTVVIQNTYVNINWIKISKIDAATITPETSSIKAEEEIKDIVLNVYPNPVSDVLFFTTDITGQTAKIFDSQTGTLVKTQEIKDNNINVSGLNRGIYFIVFDVDGKQTVKRFIKK